ncbi:MAG: carbohydrate ABC transporter permease [Anaerolineaceae bacterium]|nr:carbohydrate ABC transporter permease [Anaerolineaceae bacterium]
MEEKLGIPYAATAGRPWHRRLPKRWYAHVILITAIIITGFPVYYAVVVATQSNTQVFNYQLTPSTYLERNWDLVIHERQLPRYMLNSVIVALVMTTGKAVLSLLAGMAFVFFRIPGKWLIFGFVLITLMMPTEVMAIALFRLVGVELQWGGYEAMIVPFIASATGSFLFRQHFASIPGELSEAAQIDGANPLQFLWYVLIPISWNAIAALFVIQFLYAWNQYLWPLMVIHETTLKPVQLGLRSLRSGTETGDSFGPLMLGAVLASIPPLVVFLALQKQFMSGFALTRDK